MTFASKQSVYSVCDACRSILVRRDLDIEKIGVSAAIIEDGSPLQIGSSGRHGPLGFEVIGRIQVRYPSGFWNEWHILYDTGESGWLGEAQGNYFVSAQSAKPQAVPPFDACHPGFCVTLDDRRYAVTQVQTARVGACEGSLPFVHRDGYDAPLVDLRTATNLGATIDYSETPPLVFFGEYVEFNALGLQNLREIEGWS